MKDPADMTEEELKRLDLEVKLRTIATNANILAAVMPNHAVTLEEKNVVDQMNVIVEALIKKHAPASSSTNKGDS